MLKDCNKMEKDIKIFGNDLKSLLLLKCLLRLSVRSRIYGNPRFNFDASYEFENQLFDCGYHAVEIERSKEVWSLICSEPITFNNIDAQRYLYIDGKMLPRNYVLADLENLPLTELYECNAFDAYQVFLESYVEKKFIPSYAQNVIWRDKFQLDTEEYLVNICPWFYPYEFLEFIKTEITYHFENGNNKDKKIAYPSKGGFGAIQDSLRNSMSDHIISPKVAFRSPDNHVDLSRLNDLAEQDNAIYVVPVDLRKLMSTCDIEIANEKTNYAIMDVELDSKIKPVWTELLVADNNILIDRISAPEILSGANSTRFLQIEKELDLAKSDTNFSEKMIGDLEKLLSSIFGPVKVKNNNTKTVPFHRFVNDECSVATVKLISDIEAKYENLVVLNRSLMYRNFVDTFSDLKSIVLERIKI
jgi:hypothetical protein